jgi:hypothetical protein
MSADARGFSSLCLKAGAPKLLSGDGYCKVEASCHVGTLHRRAI